MFEKVEKIIMAAHKKIDRVSTELSDLRYEVRNPVPMYGPEIEDPEDPDN